MGATDIWFRNAAFRCDGIGMAAHQLPPRFANWCTMLITRMGACNRPDVEVESAVPEMGRLSVAISPTTPNSQR
ncbi:hypothetical protein GCM10010289_76610 [Streptomyces violascens]|nr:hypothetical protein GCM10010289_76610 [Streptomyces violascens]